MPKKVTSAKKAAVKAEKSRRQNKSHLSAVKTHIGKAEKAISGKEPAPAQAAVLQAVSALDRAAQKGVIHAHKAARHKSRLTKKFNEVFPPTASQPSGTPTDQQPS